MKIIGWVFTGNIISAHRGRPKGTKIKIFKFMNRGSIETAALHADPCIERVSDSHLILSEEDISHMIIPSCCSDIVCTVHQ